MKNLLISTLLLFVSFEILAQADPELKYDQPFTKCEKKWVVLSRSEADRNYTFGYIYIDSQAGFTFDLQGMFMVDATGRYIKDTISLKNSGSIKYRIAPNWRPVALLPSKHFNELKIKAEPDWVKTYYNYTDTLAHNYRWGWIYNDINDSQTALTYLEKVYKVNPHYPGVEFEMTFAYNALGKFNDAIKLLEPAISNDPKNTFFYKELAYAYFHAQQYEKAILTYKTGLEFFPNERSETRGEFAFNMANAYKTLNNEAEYKAWMVRAKDYTPTNSRYYKAITDAGF